MFFFLSVIDVIGNWRICLWILVSSLLMISTLNHVYVSLHVRSDMF